MAQRRDTQKQTQRKNNKKNTKIGAIVWGIVLAVVLAAAVFFASNYHQDIKQRVQNAQYPLSYSEYVEKYAKEFDLDPALVYAVMRTESSFNPEAESPAGAYGLMQITADTLDLYMSMRGEEGKYTVEDLFEPSVNIAGPGNVYAWLADPAISPDGKTLIVENIPFEETRSYVERVESTKEKYHELYD